MKIAWRDPRTLLGRRSGPTPTVPTVVTGPLQREALPAVRHYLLVPSEASALAAEAELAQGHEEARQVIVTHEPVGSGGEWKVSILDMNPPDLVRLPLVTAWLEAIARSIDGEYYGWEPTGDWSRGMG